MLKFKIQTDHKPLLGILGADKSISAIRAARVQRWALLLSACDYELEYKHGSENANADGMSRLPLKQCKMEESDVQNMVYMVELERAPVTSAEMALHTGRDPVLSKVRELVQQGWPESLEISEEIRAFSTRKQELSVEDGVVLWGGRAVIPENLKCKVLEELHMAHVGMAKMKMLARAYCWWPGMDKDVEHMVDTCTTCAKLMPDPKRSILHPWEKASGAW